MFSKTAVSSFLRSTRSCATKAAVNRSLFCSNAAQQFHASSTLQTSSGSLLSTMAKDLPHLDVVYYDHKERNWTLSLVDYYSEALAIGLIELGFIPGDKVISWMPLHWSETMVLQFACAKNGLILYQLDPDLAKTEKAADAMAAALALTEANIMIVPEAANDVNYLEMLEPVVPEGSYLCVTYGQPFICPEYPHLRQIIHTGFDNNIDFPGYFILKEFVVDSNNLDSFVKKEDITKDTPLAGTIEYKDGIPVKLGPTLTHEQVMQQKVWDTYSKILDKQFHRVEGVGVVW